jgi:hypothetical protein
MGLATRTADAFGLDRALLRRGPPGAEAIPPARIPFDTSLDARATARELGRDLPSLAELLARFRAERRAAEPLELAT